MWYECIQTDSAHVVFSSLLLPYMATSSCSCSPSFTVSCAALAPLALFLWYSLAVNNTYLIPLWSCDHLHIPVFSPCIIKHYWNNHLQQDLSTLWYRGTLARIILSNGEQEVVDWNLRNREVQINQQVMSIYGKCGNKCHAVFNL